MYRIKQKAIITVIQPQISECICDECGKVTGTKDNPKINIFSGSANEWYKELHYCKKTCAKKLGWR